MRAIAEWMVTAAHEHSQFQTERLYVAGVKDRQGPDFHMIRCLHTSLSSQTFISLLIQARQFRMLKTGPFLIFHHKVCTGFSRATLAAFSMACNRSIKLTLKNTRREIPPSTARVGRSGGYVSAPAPARVSHCQGRRRGRGVKVDLVLLSD
ncbi:hypothetical protein EVAR_22318_1 [Eumeta japonica]|uniref:Uncharacterized protein n=1 Tax=Eumeta variegata TaxID=151549 RepID=A0A4C1UAU5_EUMVA|nr:hypothetical protein EVAR_22318_1 [Eumeta japonica]